MMPATSTAARRRNHKPNGHDAEADTCPLCGTSLSTQDARLRVRTGLAALEQQAAETAKADAAAQVARVQREAVAATKAAVEKARRDATAKAEADSAKLRSQMEKIRKDAAGAMAEKVNEAVAVERQKHFAEKVGLEKKLADLQAKLAARPAYAIGQPAETDLYATIRGAFSEDQAKVTRVPPGKPGADVIVDFLHRGIVAGRVALDSKAHSRWSSRFVPKLISDGAECGAAHLILSSTVLPANVGEAGIAVIDGVICTSPSRVIPLLHLLRRHIIQLHASSVGANDRIEKTSQLYTFITGTECAGLFDQMNGATAALTDLDTKEAAAHQIVFRKRGDLIRQLQHTHTNLSARIDAIVAGSDPEPAP